MTRPLPDYGYVLQDRSGFGELGVLYVLTDRSSSGEPSGGGVLSGILFGTWSGTGGLTPLGLAGWSASLVGHGIDEGVWTDG